MNKIISTFLLAFMAASPAVAEDRVYGSVYLSGLSRDDTWPLNDFDIHNTMVCNVNGPEGFLSVRSGPGTQYEQVRAFNRLAILEVDVSQRQGNWVRVVNGLRTHDTNGNPQTYKPLPVTGWAHDGYLCSFID